MNLEFGGKRVLVTGAARGIGRDIVETFASSGANVVATDIAADRLAEFDSGRSSGPGSIETRVLDVMDERAVGSTLGDIETKTGGIDIVVHVAGGTLGQTHQPVERVTADDWDEIFKVNTRGAFFISRAVVPGMKKRAYGRIIVISSGAGLGVSMTGIQAYAAAKTAQLGFVRQLGFELGPFGITVNAVAPGFMLTNPDNDRQWASYGEAGQKRIVEQIPRRRLGKPRDIAAAVLFLASDFADWITCQVLPVNGGYVRS